MDGDEVQVVAAAGSEEVYVGPATILGLDISGPMSDKSMSSFTLNGSDEWDYEYAPTVSSVAVSGTNTIATVTLSETVLSNAADAAALKAGITFAADGTTFAALAEGDSVAVTDGKLVVTFAAAFTGSANKLKIAAEILKTTNGAIHTEALETAAFAAV